MGRSNGKVNWFAILVGLFTIIIIVVSTINIVSYQNLNFWQMSISQALTLLVAIFIAFWATQKKNDERRAKEEVEKIVRKIQEIVSSPDFYKFLVSENPDDVKKKNTMTVRRLNNYLAVLGEYSKLKTMVALSGDIKYIDEQVHAYNDFISVQPSDLDYLSKSEIHLQMYATNIDTKCDYIIMHLFTKF